MTAIELAITGGLVVTPAAAAPADILISEGTILAITPPGGAPQARETIDASGLIVLPGGVDVHTHFLIGFMGSRSVYDFYSGSVAALRGGTTTIIDFALQRRGSSFLDGLRHRRSQADGKVATDYGLHLIATDINAATLDEIPALIEAGVTSFKVYTTYPSQNLMVADGALRALLARTARYGVLVGLHAENDAIIAFETARRLAAGETAPLYHALSRPPIAEDEAISRGILLAEESGAPLYIFHMSRGRGVDMVAAARLRGSRIFAETCPHYLLLNEEVYRRPDAYRYVISPPLRTDADGERLWEGLKSGTLTTVASDDASYNEAAKKSQAASFDRIANGAPGAEERLGLLYTFGVAAGRLSLNELAEVWSGRPARLFGLAPRKGAIVPGADADLVLLDPGRRQKLSADTHFGPIGYTLYDGFEMAAVPVLTMRGGRCVVREGKFLGAAGEGRFLARRLPDFGMALAAP